MTFTLDPSRTPFSRFGSWLSVSYPTWSDATMEGPCLCSHHGRGMMGREMLRLHLLDGRKRVAELKVDADPSRLALKGGSGGRVTLAFEGAHTLRVRGEGAGLCLEMEPGWGVLAHPSPGGRVTVNARRSFLKLMIDPARGSVHLNAPWNGAASERIGIELLGDEHGVLEAAVDVFRSAWKRPRRLPFETLLRDAEADFASWLEDMPAVPGTLGRAREHAAYVNWSAVVSPGGLLKRRAMLMSKRNMDQVWSWDHCFNAMALSAGRPDLAWDQFMVMFDAQDEFGALPDSLNDLCAQFNFCKPPVHGWALCQMRRRNPRRFGAKRLAEVYEPLERWTEWWLAHRRWPGEGLPCYLHGNDSGWDNSTLFAPGVPVIGPDLAAFLVLQAEELSGIASKLKRAEDAGRWRRTARRLLDDLLKDLWRGDRFVGRLLPDGVDVECESLITALPVVLGRRLPQAVSRALVKRLERFLTPHGLATERPESPAYEADGYWRGPIWAPSTMLIVFGLRDLGRNALADRIARRFCSMCARSGFAENFDALTGKPLRDLAYTWTSSVFLMLAEELKGR